MPARSSFILYTTLERRVTANKPTAKILDIIAEVFAKPHKIIEKKPFEYQGQEGLEFLINIGNKDGIRRVRMFFHRDAIVEIRVVWGNGNEEPIADRDRL